MSFTESVSTCLRNYFGFSGRASRPEYWWFFLFVMIAGALAAMLDSFLFPVSAPIEGEVPSAAPQPIQSFVGLALFLPHMAAAFRRMHDTGRSGLYALLPSLVALASVGILIFGIGMAGLFAHGGAMDVLLTRATLIFVVPTLLVLVISPLLVLFWLSRPSQPGDNRFGPNPLEVTS